MNFKNIAKKPPMGWNSWDCYGAAVTEKEVLENAEYLAKKLKNYGWEYVVVDIQWYEPVAKSSIYNSFYPLEMDEYSRLLPSVKRFPSAANGQGFQILSQKIHKMGLKFGIHIMRGIPRQAVHQNTKIIGTEKTAREIAHPNSICPWNTDMYGVDCAKEGAQEYYNSLFNMYASWGVDFVKVDDIAASRLYHIHVGEIEMIRKAIDQCGREMVLSLSPGPAPLEYAELLKNNANMWRMTDDFWDTWDYLFPMFERCEKWAKHAGDGRWPDCDMLPLGHIGIRSVDGGGADRYTRFTYDEQQTMMSLWCIFRSPLMFGGNLPDNDEWTNSLLTNEGLLNMYQSITESFQWKNENKEIIWKAISEDAVYYALFNVSGEVKQIKLKLDVEACEIFDIWKKEVIELNPIVEFKIPAHGVKLIKVSLASASL